MTKKAAEPTDEQIIDVADDFKSSYQHAGVTVDQFDYFGFARAIWALATQQATQGVEPVAAWMSCESRRPWVANSLRERAKGLRASEKKARTAFRKDYMGEPARYFADACGDAAAVFERRLAALQSDQAQAGTEKP